MVAAGRRLPDLPAQLRRRQRRRHRRPGGHHLAGAVPGLARHRRGLAQPVLPLGAGRRRLRRRRLPRRRPAARHAGRLRRDDRRAARGRIKLIVDIVPNHTSNRHEWFREALAAAGARRPGTGTSSGTARARTDRSRRSDWPSIFGGSAWEPVPDGQWYLHLFADGAAGPELGQPRGPRRLPRHAAVLGRPRRRRIPRRRRARPGQGPLRAARVAPGRPLDGHCRTGRTRSRTATRCTRSTPNGGRSSTSTTRRAPRSPRPGCTRPGGRATPARTGWVRPSTSTC